MRDQIWHLTYFDGQAMPAATDPDGFTAGLAELMADPAGWEARIVADGPSALGGRAARRLGATDGPRCSARSPISTRRPDCRGTARR